MLILFHQAYEAMLDKGVTFLFFLVIVTRIEPNCGDRFFWGGM